MEFYLKCDKKTESIQFPCFTISNEFVKPFEYIQLLCKDMESAAQQSLTKREREQENESKTTTTKK